MCYCFGLTARQFLPSLKMQRCLRDRAAPAAPWLREEGHPREEMELPAVPRSPGHSAITQPRPCQQQGLSIPNCVCVSCSSCPEPGTAAWLLETHCPCSLGCSCWERATGQLWVAAGGHRDALSVSRGLSARVPVSIPKWENKYI